MSVETKPVVKKSDAVKASIVSALSTTTPVTDVLIEQLTQLSANGKLTFPKGYDVASQAKLMFVDVQQSGVLNKVTSTSVAQAFALALLQGLEYDKKQVYFIPYGDKLTCIRSYFGDTAVAKRTGLVKDIYARVIYEGDTYEIDLTQSGEECIRNHKTTLENHDKIIVGAYARCVDDEGHEHYCIMSRKELEAAWSKSKTRASSSSVHNEFPQEMAKRTVIRRLVKLVFNTAPTNISEATKSIINAYNRSTSDEYDDHINDANVAKEVECKTTTGRRTNVIAPKIARASVDTDADARKREINPEPTSEEEADIVSDDLPETMASKLDYEEEIDKVTPPLFIQEDDELDF